MQEVGLDQLAGWMRETARSGGMASAPFCHGLQDAAAKDWQSAAIEKRYMHCLLIVCNLCEVPGPVSLTLLQQSDHS